MTKQQEKILSKAIMDKSFQQAVYDFDVSVANHGFTHDDFLN